MERSTKKTSPYIEQKQHISYCLHLQFFSHFNQQQQQQQQRNVNTKSRDLSSVDRS